MALTDKIKLQAQAAQAGIAGYRQMSEDELRAALGSAQTPAKGSGGATAAKGAGTNGTATKKTATAVVKGAAAPAKGSAPKGAGTTPATKGSAPKASTPAPAAKSTSRKTAPKAQAAKGEVKRPATGSVKGAAVKGAASAPAKKTTATKPKATTTRRTTRQATTANGRVALDPKAIDWTIESKVGKAGKRKLVFDALAKLQDYGKVFTKLQGHAMEWYPTALNTYPDAASPEDAANRMLKWLIARVAYDYAKKTGQHDSGTRAGYGESQGVQDVRRRQIRAAAEGKAATSTKARKAAISAAGVKGHTVVIPPAKQQSAGKPAPAAPKKQTTPAKGAAKGAAKTATLARKPAATKPPARKPAASAPAKKPAANRKGGALAMKG